MARTATLMIGGDICTRKCRFCNTLSGRPSLLNPDEPRRVAESVKALKLRYAVITSVDRDRPTRLWCSPLDKDYRRDTPFEPRHKD